MSKNKSQLSPTRDSVDAAIESLQLAIPHINRVIGAAQHDRGTGFVDTETNLNHDKMSAKLANALTKAAEEMRVLTDNVIRAQMDHIAYLETEKGGKVVTRKTPAERMADVKAAMAELQKELGRKPSQREIGERAGLSQGRVQTLLKEMNNDA